MRAIWQDATAREIVRRLIHEGCGGRPKVVELATDISGSGSQVPRSVRLVGRSGRDREEGEETRPLEIVTAFCRCNGMGDQMKPNVVLGVLAIVCLGACTPPTPPPAPAAVTPLADEGAPIRLSPTPKAPPTPKRTTSP